MPHDFDLFLSHNSGDKADVIKLKALLDQRPLKCWLDKDELRPGQNWMKLLEKGLGNSRAIAACFGRSGLGPWHDEEIQAALQMAVREGRPVIPVLLPNAGKEPELPLFLRNRGWVDFRTGYSTGALDALVWGVTGIKPSEEKGPAEAITASPLRASSPPTSVSLERLSEVFGSQFERLKALLEGNQPFRELLVRRFNVGGASPSQVTAALMLEVHLRFLPAIGTFGQLYRDSPHKEAVAELVSTVLYLSMSPDFAEQLRDRNSASQGGEIPIDQAARQGIAELLICWTRHKPIVPVRLASQEKPLGIFETTPQMSLTEIKMAVMDKLGINSASANSEALLEQAIRLQNDFGEPAYMTVGEKSLVDQIRAPGSPLRDLLLFIKIEGQSINPSAGARYDSDVEAYLAKLKKIFAQS